MRDSINDFLSQTIIFNYSLPHNDISKTNLSTLSDKCFSVSSDSNLSKLIYNGIAEYALGEKHVDITNLNLVQRRAIKTRLRFDEKAEKQIQLKYGFYGEVVLDLILQYIFSSNVLLAKGYFYNPLEGAETKGYDAYQFYYSEQELTLLLGEVKFYASFRDAIKRILDNLEKATDPQYFNKNVLALINEKSNFDSVPNDIVEIIGSWEENPDINLYNEVVNHSIKLQYPMLVLYDSGTQTYDDIIISNIKTINEEFSKRQISIVMNIDLLFILIPVSSSKLVKEEVIQCILENRPLLS